MTGIEKQLSSLSGQLISISEAAQNTPYSAEYLSLLARKGKLKAIKISRDWLTTREAVLEYVKAQAIKHKKMLLSLENVQFGGGPQQNFEQVRVRARQKPNTGIEPPSVGERGRV